MILRHHFQVMPFISFIAGEGILIIVIYLIQIHKAMLYHRWPRNVTCSLTNSAGASFNRAGAIVVLFNYNGKYYCRMDGFGCFRIINIRVSTRIGNLLMGSPSIGLLPMSFLTFIAVRHSDCLQWLLDTIQSNNPFTLDATSWIVAFINTKYASIARDQLSSRSW